jgi:hypothetical protein
MRYDAGERRGAPDLRPAHGFRAGVSHPQHYFWNCFHISEMELRMPSSNLDQLAALLGAFALGALVALLTLLRAEQLGYAGVQFALLVVAPAAFLAGVAIFGEALNRLADRPVRRQVAGGALRA